MGKVMNVYKPVGVTPLEVINKIKEKDSKYKDVSMTYAGRLDPLAEGVLVLLAGDTVYEKEKYLGLDKEYEAEILLGFQTDTFDVLGLLVQAGLSINKEKLLAQELEDLKGDFVFDLPVYSSFKIKGKPLFWWARERRLNKIEIPKRKTKIYDIKSLDSYSIESEDLLKSIEDKINLVRGDFRQEEIKENWQKFVSAGSSVSHRYKVIRIRVICSSGTYIRVVADKLGGVLLGLKRIKVGDFHFKNSMLIY